MGVCRRIFKHSQPSELTICVTICCEPRSPPRFNQWTISKPGCPPRIIPSSIIPESKDPNRSRRRTGKKVERLPTPETITQEFDDLKKPEDPIPPITPNLNFKKFDLLSNDEVALELVKSKSIEDMKKLRRKKKSKTPEDAPRYREFTETTIHMYVEMDKRNIGEFVWDQQCTRIDALVAPIMELDRTNTPEVPVEIEIFD